MQDFNVIQDFLARLTSEQLLLLSILGLLIFMLGICVGWIVQGSKTRRFSKQLMLVTRERDELQHRVTTMEADHQRLAKELEQTSAEKVSAIDQLRDARTEINDLNTQLTGLRSDNEQLTVTNQSYATTIEDLNDQIIGLKTRNEQLLQDAGGDGTIPRDRGTVSAVSRNGEDDRYQETVAARLEAFERRLNDLSRENERLREQADEGGENGFGGGRHRVSIGEPLVIRADTTEPGVRRGSSGEPEVIVNTKPSLQVPVIETVAEYYDDLTRIDAIGPFNQRKLNEVGVYSYEQIANWSDDDISAYATRIGYLADIIRREDWVGQARALVRQKRENPDDFQRRPPGVAPDDLLVLSGIDSKAERALSDAGIDGWQALSERLPTEVRAMLEHADLDPAAYATHSRWPREAELASQGQWNELKEMQSADSDE